MPFQFTLDLHTYRIPKYLKWSSMTDRILSFFLSFVLVSFLFLFFFFLQFSHGCEVYLPVLGPMFWSHLHYRNTVKYVYMRHKVNKSPLVSYEELRFFFLRLISHLLRVYIPVYQRNDQWSVLINAIPLTVKAVSL